MTNTALILIDIQNDYFAGGLMALEDMAGAAANAAQLLGDARRRGMPIFRIRHIAGSADAAFFRPGTKGSEIHEIVRPMRGETVVEKNRPNAFVGTGLKAALRGAEVARLVICGAMSQMCVDATTRAAVDLGFNVTVVEDACAAAQVRFNGVTVSARQVHAAIMAPIAASYAEVAQTRGLLSAIDPA